MTARRIRFNRSIFAVRATGWQLESLLVELAAEDIELVVDVRGVDEMGPDEGSLDLLCANANMYYVRLEDFGDAERERTAQLALRHRTCVLANLESTSEPSQVIAEAAGMRVIDLDDSPAPLVRRLIDHVNEMAERNPGGR